MNFQTRLLVIGVLILTGFGSGTSDSRGAKGAPLAQVPAMHDCLKQAMISGDMRGPQDDSETVLTNFRIRDGKEADFLKTDQETWAAYTAHDLVNPKFHLLLRGTDESGKLMFTEVFTWKNHNNPDHVGPDIKTLWAQLESECEPREAHRGIEFSEVHIVDNIGR